MITHPTPCHSRRTMVRRCYNLKPLSNGYSFINLAEGLKVSYISNKSWGWEFPTDDILECQTKRQSLSKFISITGTYFAAIAAASRPPAALWQREDNAIGLGRYWRPYEHTHLKKTSVCSKPYYEWRICQGPTTVIQVLIIISGVQHSHEALIFYNGGIICLTIMIPCGYSALHSVQSLPVAVRNALTWDKWWCCEADRFSTSGNARP